MSDTAAFRVRPVTPDDRPWVTNLLTTHWGDTALVTRGRVHQGAELPGFIAEEGGERIGLITYRLDGEECEVVSLNSLRERRGIGGALMAQAEEAARAAGTRRVWLITTNDNLPAVGFYQRRGYRLAAVHAGAIETSRRIKPSIPEVGIDGIPIRDEIELDKLV